MKVLQGTFRPDRAVENEMKPDPETPGCPTWLGTEAKREWRRVVPELEKMGVLTQIDRAALAAYCQCYERWYQAEKELKKLGSLTYETPWGIEIPRPQVGIASAALKQMRDYLTQFGMTPSARSRVSVPDKGKKGQTPNNPFDELRKRRSG